MNPATSYDWFEGTITIKLALSDAGREYPLEVSAHAFAGDEPDQSQEQTVEVPVNKVPPNVVRVETGQDVPVLAKSGDGPATVKGIRYKKGSAPKTA